MFRIMIILFYAKGSENDLQKNPSEPSLTKYYHKRRKHASLSLTGSTLGISLSLIGSTHHYQSFLDRKHASEVFDQRSLIASFMLFT
jgi:hypothetical protein